MNSSGENEPSSVFALLAGARYASEQSDAVSNATPRRTAEPLTVLASLAEARAAVDTAAASAQRMISIYTPDLEPELYDQSSFLEIIMRDSNRFVAMGRRLSSYIDIRYIAEHPQQRASAYLIADDRAIVYRLRADTWDGIADFNNPPVARLYLNEFDAVWNASAPEHTLRNARSRG